MKNQKLIKKFLNYKFKFIMSFEKKLESLCDYITLFFQNSPSILQFTYISSAFYSFIKCKIKLLIFKLPSSIPTNFLLANIHFIRKFISNFRRNFCLCAEHTRRSAKSVTRVVCYDLSLSVVSFLPTNYVNFLNVF